MTTAPTTINPKFMEVLARVNTEGSFQTTFEQLLRQLEGVVAAARLPALVAAFAEIGLMFHPSAEEGGFETPRIVSPRRKKAVAVGLAMESIQSGESARVEFKSSLRYNYKTAEVDKAKLSEPGPCNLVRDQALKAICGFHNSEGGDLFIGVRDDGEIVGIEPDFDLIKRQRPNADDGDLWKQQLIADMHGRFHEPNPVIQRTQIEILELSARLVARIAVHRGDKLAFLKYGEGSGERPRAFIRQSVTTRELEPPAIEEYVRIRAYQARAE